jgi:hypothetical protein
MATDTDRQAVEATKFRKKLDGMVVVATDPKKRYDASRAQILTAIALLEEEERVAAVLAEETHAAIALVEPPSPTLPLAPADGAAPSNNDYEAIIIANVHHRQRPHPGRIRAEHLYSCLGRVGPLLNALCPMARQCTTHPLSVPCRPGIPTYKLQAKTKSRACVHALPRALWLRTPPPYSGRLQWCHASHGCRPRLPAQEGFVVAMCPVDPDLASLLRRGLVPPHVPRLRISPLYSGGLLCCHMSHGSGPRTPYSVGLQCCHVSRNSEPHLPAREGSSATMCPIASDHASLLRRASMLPHVSPLWSLPPY